MQVYFHAGSPLIQYGPCRACDVEKGWLSNAVFEGDNATVASGGESVRTKGTDDGFVTSAQNATLGLNFTGTGIKFDVAFAPVAGASGPGAGAGVAGATPDWTTTLLVNGSAPPSTATTVPAGVVGLPAGTHQFQLQLSRKDNGPANATWARLDGVRGTMAGLIQASTVNTTIDDSAWANGTVALSQGWNMIEGNAGNWINETQYQQEVQNIDRHYNRSISWTTEPGANSTISFSGSAVWVFGLTGGEAGTFEVRLDNVTQGVFDAAGGPRTYNQTLWHASSLTDGPHTVQLINQQGRLSFDYLVATTGINEATMGDLAHPSLGTKTPLATPASTATATGGAAAASSNREHNTAVVVGASVGGVIALLLLTLAAFLLWTRCRRRNKKPNHHQWQEKKPWYKFGRDKGWGFVSLVDEPHKQMAHNGMWNRVSRTDTFKSTSSFGSSGSGIRQPAPAHTRRSLLPMANNLWAKKKNEQPHPLTEVRTSLQPPSPDPMTFALGGASSPLTELQRNNADAAQAKVGTKEWYDWFGFSVYSDNKSCKSGLSGTSSLPRPPGARYNDPSDGSGAAADGYALGEDRSAPKHYYNDVPLSPQRRYQ